MTATMTLSFTEYEAMRADKLKLERDLADTQIALTAAKLVDPSTKLAPVLAFARDCLTITRFAVANLPPEMIRGWPYEALVRVAQELPNLPDASIDDRDMATEFLSFAKECEEHAIRRSKEPKPTKMTALDIEEQRRRLEGDPIAQVLMDRPRSGDL